MLRKIFLTAAIIGIPLMAWVTFQYAQLHPVPFETALLKAEGSSESDQAKKFLVRGRIVSADAHEHEGHSADEGGKEFTMIDEAGKTFRVSYTGKEKIEGLLKEGQQISVVGHVHGTADDNYFHASQALEKY